jgi:hypothetical protein
MLPYIISGTLILAGALVGLVAIQPNDFRIARTIAINATPEQVFDHVNTMKSWEQWSPFHQLDPEMKQTYVGPPAGVGASYTWAGNKNAGEGRSTIVASNPHESVQFKLEFYKPFKATNDVQFTFEPQGEQTVVTWAMSGKKNFVFKAMGLVMDCDKMCADMFDKGLASLKEVAETSQAPHAL